ncbi:MAG TPA: hypothetical protein DFI00_05905 [Rhodospirillaceae bacterium]|nr:hypothetical protein [Alphaproteobacteria bacterium]OUT41552.1 MAG: hypothetical protein CBB62_04255 [Micavibrio sp. TMED2]HCI46809.1 hypothetical protein [Rhodospirillaceae bacterium]MAS46885.1 hypothetical protein [Alphaproteobacteria bacterium]MAX94980.1 hypothetical protein [Alphaproteobacteria bacterium]|tara:strand:- start:521 stop:1753 length:1233 start_codon:yes stop_codon:yes gene_type:complete
MAGAIPAVTVDQRSANILLINRFYGYEARVPTARLLADLAAELDATGLQADAVSAVSGNASDPSIFSRFLAHPKLLLRALFQRQKPDYIVVLSDPPMVLFTALLLGMIRRVPVMYWCHDIYPDVINAMQAPWQLQRIPVRLMRPLHRWLVRRCDWVVVPSACLRQQLLRQNPDIAVTVMPNWPERVLEPARPLPSSKPLRLLYSGHYGIGHDLGDLLRAHRVWAQSVTPVDVHLALSERGEQRLRRQYAGSDLLDGIRITRLVPEAELGEHLQNAHIHVVSIKPSASGTIMPCKSMASLHVGRPVLLLGGPDTELARMITDHDLGHVVPAGDTTGLLQWVQVLSTEPERLETMAGNAGRYAEELFARHPAERLAALIASRAMVAVSDRTPHPVAGSDCDPVMGMGLRDAR